MNETQYTIFTVQYELKHGKRAWTVYSGDDRLCLVCLLAGIGIGAIGYYTYANHMYRKHPEFFLKVLERKIAKWKTKE